MGLRDLAIGIFAPLAKLLGSAPVGSTFTARDRKLPAQDGREHALAKLREYLAAVPFADPEDPARTFNLSVKDIHADYADPEQQPKLPAAGVVSADADIGSLYLGSQIIEEETLNVYGPNTALAFFGFHTEEIVVELWCRDVPQRRAVVAGLKFAFWAQEGRGCIDLPLPAYYDRKARFWLHGAWVIDEPESLRGGRRRALLKVQLQVPEVLLVDAGTMRLMSRVDVA